MVMGLALATLVPAMAVASSASDRSSVPGFTWQSAVPGERVAASDIARTSARAAGIQPASLRRVASAGSGIETTDLLAGENSSGDVCFGISTPIQQSSFACLDQLGRDGNAIVAFPTFGGGPGDAIASRSIIVGVLRDDVARLVAVLPAGTTRDIAFDEWRGFAYEAHATALVPTALVAYDASGTLLQQQELSTAAP